jgi:hypothetical protein
MASRCDGNDLAHRADPEVRVSEKWIRVPGPNDALIEEGASDQTPTAESTLGPILQRGGNAV